MSGEAQTASPAAAPENRQPTEAPEPATPDGGELNATQKQEFWALKKKAEETNRILSENEALKARLSQMERLSWSQGAGQATDPLAQTIAVLQQESAAGIESSTAALTALQMAAQAKAEAALTRATSRIPEAKRDRVEDLIRAHGYQLSVQDALKMVTDPDSEPLAARLRELEAENAKLKERAAQPHGVSPATAPPAAEQAASSEQETVPWSEANAILKAGGPHARELRDKMDGRKVRIDYAR